MDEDEDDGVDDDVDDDEDDANDDKYQRRDAAVNPEERRSMILIISCFTWKYGLDVFEYYCVCHTRMNFFLCFMIMMDDRTCSLVEEKYP